jgi:glycosyltransferase involved in cell wall biosynthesis
MKLSVLMPVYNERETIEEILTIVSAVEVDKEIIVVDDCSTDGTSQILDRWAGRIRLLRHPKNRGKGAGVRTALAAATGDAIIIQDADLEYDPQEYARLLSPIERGEAEVVYGVRSLEEQKLHMRLGNKFMTAATNLLYGTHLCDVETCYKVLSRQVFEQLDLQSEGFDLETEITAQIVQLGYDIYEVPISYHPRYGQDKKLTPLDGVPTLWALVRHRFSPSRRALPRGPRSDTEPERSA